MKPVAFGNYTLLRRLAGGGMAELYLARVRGPAGAERLAAVKLLPSRLADDATLRDMFRDEVRIAATLHHPNIGQVFEVGTLGGQYFLALEYIHGRDLRAVVNACRRHGRPGVPAPIALYVGTRVCAALQHAHEARGLDGQPLGIVHRDVSPSNIMLTFDGDVKLVDFGIARLARPSALTHPGYVKGKVRYLTPEQLLGRPVDHRADLFMLGISLWEATVGEHLFAGDDEHSVYREICSGQVRRPTTIVRGYPPALEAVVLRALAFAPEQRFASAHALHSELVRVAEGQRWTLSELRAAEMMREVFAQEVGAWHDAQRGGIGLINHLLATIAEEPTDAGPPLAHVDQVTTTPPAAAAPAPAAAAQPTTPSTGGISDRRQTVIFGAKGSRLPFSTAHDAPSTEAHGLAPGQGDDPTAPPGTSAAPSDPTADVLSPSAPEPRAMGHRPLRGARSLRVSSAAAVAITPDGAAELLEAAGDDSQSPEGAAALTLTAGHADRVAAVTDGHPTQIDATPAFAQTAGPETADARWGEAPLTPSAPALGASAPAQTRADPAGTGTRMRRVATADWSHRPPAEGRRPGTHPYFVDRQTAIGSTLLQAQRSPPAARRARASRLIASAVVLISIILGTVALLLLTRGRRDDGPEPRPSAVATPASAARRPVRLTSTPSGASVYRAADGIELGKTPLALEGPGPAGLKIELHRPGYEIMALTIAANSGTIHAELRPQTPIRPDRHDP